MKRREPFEFMLWTGIVGMGLTFLVLTFFYLMRTKGAQTSLHLPIAFGISTIVILLSSLFLHLANRSFTQEYFLKYRVYLGITLLLGITFVLCQWWGWNGLQSQGFLLKKGKVSGSFIYMITGLHVVHLFGGVIALLYIFVRSITKHKYVDAFIYAVNPPNQLRLKLVSIYWHFVDAVWLYLYLFFLFNFH